MNGGQRRLGRLVPVDLRHYWQREDSDFTPWLALEENIGLLAEVLGMNLEVERREQPVGAYSADLLCTNLDDGRAVVIENQLEATDHGHLGQLVTYAAGLEAPTVVWIAARFKEDHRAAIDWLNEISHEEQRFFALEVELWRIDDSPPAPKFNVVAQPNDWSRAVRQMSRGHLSDTQQLRFEFWSGSLAHLLERNSVINGHRTPTKQPFMSWFIGFGGFSLYVPVGFRDGYVSAELLIADDHEAFHLLEERREEIEKEVGRSLEWDFKEGRKSSYLRLRWNNVDPTNRESWSDLFSWLRVNLETLQRVLPSWLQRLDELRATSPDRAPTEAETY